MPAMSTSVHRHALNSSVLAASIAMSLALALVLPRPAIASDGQDTAQAPKPAARAGKSASTDGAVEPSKSEAKPEAKPGVKAESASGVKIAAVASVDPMELLREKLAQKLGAGKAPDTPNPYVLRVSSKADSGHTEPASARTQATSKSKPTAADAQAAQRADKAAADRGPDGHAAHWSYGGAGGPETWGSLKPEFAKCSSGTRQSPIDIRGGVQVDLDPVQFDYRPSAFRVVDNGHTVQVNLAPGNSIEVLGRRFELLQFHFHRPSEERIDGRQFDMVAHLVHQDVEGRLAVVAVLLDRGSAHPLVQSVWNNLPLEKGDEVAAKAPLDLNQLLPQDRRYFTYMGSLTTPPCSEGGLWMVMKQPVPIAPAQIDVFSRLYPMNARPIQSASGRLIKHSN
jgi:carbonic anhydrase